MNQNFANLEEEKQPDVNRMVGDDPDLMFSSTGGAQSHKDLIKIRKEKDTLHIEERIPTISTDGHNSIATNTPYRT